MKYIDTIHLTPWPPLFKEMGKRGKGVRWTFCLLVFLLTIPTFSQNTWTKYPGNPVLKTGNDGEWDNFLLTGSIILDDDQYKLWYVGLSEWTLGSAKLGLATSEDGLSWSKYEENPLNFECSQSPWDTSFQSVDVHKIDTVYHMWYGGPMKGSLREQIGYAWSDDGLRWTKYPEPVLRPGDSNDWDALVIAFPKVLIEGGQYKMWYLGADDKLPSTYRIGYAESSDGIHWKKHPSNPVLDVGPPGSWEDGRFDSFSIRKNDSIYEMWYSGYNYITGQIGYAYSYDGIHWIKHPHNPVINPGELGMWDSWVIYPFHVNHAESEYNMLYLGLSGNWDQGYGFATTSLTEVNTWDKLDIEVSKREISVNIFNRVERIKLDSLVSIIPGLRDIELTDVYNKLALGYSLNDDKKSFKYAEKAAELADKNNYPTGKALALYSKGNAQFVQDNYSDALANQLLALWLFDSLEMMNERGNLMAQIAGIHRHTGSFDLAERYFMQALEVFYETDDQGSIQRALRSLGYTYLEANDTINAINTFRSGLSLARINGRVWSEANGNMDLGRCFTGNNLDSAIFYFNKAQKIFDTLSYPWKGHNLLFTALAYYRAGPGHYTEAEEYFEKSHEIFKHDGREGRVRFAYSYAELYFETARYENAKIFLDIALSICQGFIYKVDHEMFGSLIDKLENEVYLTTYMEKICKLYYRLDTAVGDETAAFKHFMLATQWHDSIYNEQSRRKIAMMQGKYETESTQNHIFMLQKENEVKDLRIRHSSFILIGMGGILVLIILMALLFIRQNKIRSEHKAVMLEQKLLRLQMNPHFIFNALSNILNLINRNSNEIASKYLTRFSKLLRNTLEGSRQDYIKLDDEINGLENYLELQKLRFGDKFDYELYVDATIDTESTLIPPLLVQPFIENAIEHGIKHKKSKGNVRLRFLNREKRLVCEIEDDGVGREKAWKLEYSSHKDHESLATTIIRERIQSLNKNLKNKIRLKIIDLKSEDDIGIGTKVVIALPN